jgi:flagellar secretion chaperone FliS
MMNPNEVYQRNQVTTARPEELTLMLYNGAIRFIQQAKQAISKKDLPLAHTFIMKTQDIITELMVTLNMDYEVSKSLQSLYEFIKGRLIEANLSKDPAILDEVQNILTELKSTWTEAMKLVKNS